MPIDLFDVVIIGAGPAGLSAALVLGRARRRVMVIDAGAPRSAVAAALHGLITRDGVAPDIFRNAARADLRPYSVALRDGRVAFIERDTGAFRILLDDGAMVLSRRILLSTGVVEDHPEIPGYRNMFGVSVHLCPYCHGWECRDRRLGILAWDESTVEAAVVLTAWSRDIMVFVDPAIVVPISTITRYAALGIHVISSRVRALLGNGGKLRSVELEDGRRVPRDALFVRPRPRQADLIVELGLAFDDHGFVVVDEHQRTTAPGVYAAGDLAGPGHSVLLAAAAGARAAHAIGQDLTLDWVARTLDVIPPIARAEPPLHPEPLEDPRASDDDRDDGVPRPLYLTPPSRPVVSEGPRT